MDIESIVQRATGDRHIAVQCLLDQFPFERPGETPSRAIVAANAKMDYSCLFMPLITRLKTRKSAALNDRVKEAVAIRLRRQWS
jgi:hypothetical protein